MRTPTSIATLATALLIIPTTGSAQDCSPPDLFTTSTMHGQVFCPRGLTIGDVNADGYGDVIAVNTGIYGVEAPVPGTSITVFIGHPDGTLADGIQYDCAHGPTSAHVVDLNRDGYGDLAVTSFEAGVVSILLNNGDGTFTDHVDYTVGAGPTTIASGDWDADGDNDLAVSCTQSDGVRVLMNIGAGVFDQADMFGSGTTASVIACHVDGDSHVDLVATRWEADDAIVLRNEGDGSFAVHDELVTGKLPTHVASADLDGDDAPDIVVSSFLGDSAYVFFNDGNGEFTGSKIQDIAGAAWITIGDFDADSDPDVVIGQFDTGETGQATLLVNDGMGSLTAAPLLSLPSDLYALAGGDIDGNGQPDLAVTHCSPDGDLDSVRVLINQCDPPECAGDLNSDGFVDVIDLIAVVTAWGTSDPEADIDGSGVVDVGDLVALIVFWGPC